MPHQLKDQMTTYMFYYCHVDWYKFEIKANWTQIPFIEIKTEVSESAKLNCVLLEQDFFQMQNTDQFEENLNTFNFSALFIQR